MKYILCIFFLVFSFALNVGASPISDLEERLKKIKEIEDVYFIRLTILTDRLTLIEAELEMAEDSYKKSLLSEEIKMIKENIQKENEALEKKIDVITHGVQTPLPREMTESIDKTTRLFHYFRHR